MPKPAVSTPAYCSSPMPNTWHRKGRVNVETTAAICPFCSARPVVGVLEEKGTEPTVAGLLPLCDGMGVPADRLSFLR